jgi:magnesium-protoporphyrin O-methyltransferase
METTTYLARRGELEEYFDRTAASTWAKLTSDAPVGSIRATVRAGRDRMRATLLGYLPDDLRGQRLLDAGCGTGALACEAAARGAEVVATDLSATLVELAASRVAPALGSRISFRVADMLEPSLGDFDWIVGMDSLIHYEAPDMVEMIARLCGRARRGVLVTFAPRTPLLTVMHAFGRVFPRANRAPAIEPISERTLRELLAARSDLADLEVARSERIDVGFYKSQTLEIVRR